MKKGLYRAAAITCVLVWAVSGIKQLKEPDFWWQLRTGEWMLANKAVTHSDMFSYTYEGTPWINVKWLYEVLIAWLANHSSPEMVQALQIGVNLLLLGLLFAIARFTTERSNLSRFLQILFAFLVLFCAHIRLNGRPEMTSHVLFLVYILLHFVSRTKGHKWLYWFIPLQVFWANMHEAFGIGIVMLLLFTGSAWVEWIITRTKEKIKYAQQSTLSSLLAIAAISINPNGPKMILHPFEIFRQIETNVYTSESFPYTDPAYWIASSYLNIWIFGFCLLAMLTVIWGKKISDWLPAFSQKTGLAYPALICLFFYLSLKANRNIIFSAMAAYPMMIIGSTVFLSFVYSRFTFLKRLRLSLVAPILLIVLGITSYWWVASGKFYKQFNPRTVYGLKVMTDANPLRVSEFIKTNHISGRCFSDYLISSYLLWALQPDFKTYIDLRDMDVFPDAFFKNFFKLTQQPRYFDKADSLFHFNYAVVYRPMYESLHQYLDQHPNWLTVYADPVAVVYLKRNEMNKPIIEKLIAQTNAGDMFMKPAIELKPLKGLPYLISKFFNPFWDQWQEEKKINYDLIAALYYYQTQQKNLSLTRATLAGQHDKPDANTVYQQGDIFLQWGMRDTAFNNQFVLQAEQYFHQALSLDAQNSNALMGLGRLALYRGDLKAAEGCFKNSLKADQHNGAAHTLMAQTLLNEQSQGLARNETQEKIIWHMEQAVELQPENTLLLFQLGELYCRFNECSKGVPIVEKYLYSVPISAEELETAKQLLRNCN